MHLPVSVGNQIVSGNKYCEKHNLAQSHNKVNQTNL